MYQNRADKGFTPSALCEPTRLFCAVTPPGLISPTSRAPGCGRSQQHNREVVFYKYLVPTARGEERAHRLKTEQFVYTQPSSQKYSNGSHIPICMRLGVYTKYDLGKYNTKKKNTDFLSPLQPSK